MEKFKTVSLADQIFEKLEDLMLKASSLLQYSTLFPILAKILFKLVSPSLVWICFFI